MFKRPLVALGLVALASMLLPLGGSPAKAGPPAQNCVLAQSNIAALCYGNVLGVSPNPPQVGRSLTVTVPQPSSTGFRFDSNSRVLALAAPNAVPYVLCGAGSSVRCQVNSVVSLTTPVAAQLPTLRFTIVVENREPETPTTGLANCRPTCTTASGGPFQFTTPPISNTSSSNTSSNNNTSVPACPAGQVRESNGCVAPVIASGGSIVWRCNNMNPNLNAGYGMGILTTEPQYCYGGAATDTGLRATQGPNAYGPGSTWVDVCNYYNPNLGAGYGQGVLTTHGEYCATHTASDTHLRILPGAPAGSLFTGGNTPVYVCTGFNPRGAAYGQGVLTTQPQFCAGYADTGLRVR